MAIDLRQISVGDDLAAICVQMQPEDWGKDNEMTSYQEPALGEFLADDKHLLVLAYDGEKIAGAALCYELPHPDGKSHNLYVHELDTHPDFRRRGVATAIVQELFKIAEKRCLDEVWLGTETDNDTANAFYKSLNPTEIELSITYSWEMKSKDAK